MIVYTKDYRCGVFSPKRYGELIAQVTEIKLTTKFINEVEDAIKSGINLEEFYKKIKKLR